jgi:hypothetical protein
VTATVPPPADVRDCKLYRFYGWDPRTNYTTKTLIYIGETAREPFDRMMEHIARQPWADTITSWVQDDAVFAGKDDVLRAEKAAVEAEKPLYNDEWNRGNRRRIELGDAKVQRWARDDARGVPRWRPPSKKTMYRGGRPVAAPNERPPARPSGRKDAKATRARRATDVPAVRPWQKDATGFAIVWGVLTLAGWVVLTHAGMLTENAATGMPLVSFGGALWVWRRWKGSSR